MTVESFLMTKFPRKNVLDFFSSNMTFKALREDKNVPCTLSQLVKVFSFPKRIFYHQKYENKYLMNYYHHYFIFIKFDLFSLILQIAG